MNPRLALLEKMINSGHADAFAHYGLAMEYRKENRVEDALRIFQKLRDLDSQYLPQYLMAGQMLAESDKDAATEWLKAGIEVAKATGDGKTLSELEAELDSL